MEASAKIVTTHKVSTRMLALITAWVCIIAYGISHAGHVDVVVEQTRHCVPVD